MSMLTGVADLKRGSQRILQVEGAGEDESRHFAVDQVCIPGEISMDDVIYPWLSIFSTVLRRPLGQSACAG